MRTRSQTIWIIYQTILSTVGIFAKPVSMAHLERPTTCVTTFAVSPAYTSGTIVSLEIANGPLDEGDYQLTVTASLVDVVGNPLDGDGNGTGGDNFVRLFSVDFADVYQFEGRANDEQAIATPLKLTEDPGGSGFSIGRGIGSVDPSGDTDWWSFEAIAGDFISISVDSVGNQSFDSEINLWDSTGGYITGDRDSGPDQGSYVSRYEVPADGTYSIEVLADSFAAQGNYQLRVESARGIDLEFDRFYYNNSTANADPITLKASGVSQVGAVGGTLMAREGTTFDLDYFSIGSFSAGNTIELDLRLPSTSSITMGRLRLLDADSNPIADEDGNPNDAHFLATLTADGAYFAEVSAAHIYEGHLYIPGTPRNWDDARAYAQSFGGDLVSVNDQAEQDFVTRTFGVLNPWLGLNDIDNEGTHVWANGDPVTYTNWSPGEPNTPSWDGAYLSSSGRWFDYPVTSSWGVLAEVDPPVSTADGGPGPFAQYVLDVEVADTVPPQVVDLSRIPAEAQTTDDVIGSFEVTFSEGLLADSVNNPAYEFAGFNDHTYVLTPDYMTWTEAESYAQSLGGHLVTVNDQAEQDFLLDTFVDFEPLWIGYSDSATEGTYVWADGDASDFTNWGGGYPLGDSVDYYDFAVIDFDGFWYNYDYNLSEHFGIVEIPSSALLDSDADTIPDNLDHQPDDPLNGWDLREAGIDGAFGTADDVLYDVRVSPEYAGGTVVSLVVGDGPLDEGDYQLTITSSLVDVVGNPLDGDGNGTGGDDFVRSFSVDFADIFQFEGRGNDSYFDATPLSLEEDPGGSGFSFGHGIGSIDPSGDFDWWSFSANAGDFISISVDPAGNQGFDSDIVLYDSSGSYILGDRDGGPEQASFISHYEVPSDGTYFVEVSADSFSDLGHYHLRVERARGINLESDRFYANGSVAAALTLDSIRMTGAGGHQVGAVAGTLMGRESTQFDQDGFFARCV